MLKKLKFSDRVYIIKIEHTGGGHMAQLYFHLGQGTAVQPQRMPKIDIQLFGNAFPLVPVYVAVFKQRSQSFVLDRVDGGLNAPAQLRGIDEPVVQHGLYLDDILYRRLNSVAVAVSRRQTVTGRDPFGSRLPAGHILFKALNFALVVAISAQEIFFCVVGQSALLLA